VFCRIDSLSCTINQSSTGGRDEQIQVVQVVCVFGCSEHGFGSMSLGTTYGSASSKQRKESDRKWV
jgi:hypothetical protein